MIKKIAAIISVLLLFPSNSYAFKICSETMSCNGDSSMACMTLNAARCKTSMFKYYEGTYGVKSCTSCNSGESLQELSISIPGCSNKVTYNDCCRGCSSCGSDTNWSAHKEGYEKKITRRCECNRCVETTSYRCAVGYYGIATLSATGCTKCPDGGTTSSAGSLHITDCYKAAGTTSKDTSGTYTFTDKCSYQN